MLMKVQKIENLCVLQALDLQLCVCPYVRRHKCRRGDSEHVLGEFFLFHELRTRHAHQLDADAHESHVVDIWSDVGSWSRKPNPGRICARLSENAAPQFRRKAVVNNELSAHDSVCLRVSASLKSSWLPKQGHLIGEALDDRVDPLLFILKSLFLGDLQTLVSTARVDQG